MKLMTVTVPCYNSEAYMCHCLDTLLCGGEDVEIIIVNDGSKDHTGEIADSYAAKYPSIVKVIHQENGGHGEGVNQGMRHATGLFFKVVDSDDWVDEEAFRALLDNIRYMVGEGKIVDMYVCNYVYEHTDGTPSYTMQYSNRFPTEQICGWSQVRTFDTFQYLMMHSVFYRTEILRKSGVVLPKHTFYVDNLYMYQPLPYVKTIYYMNLNLYRYFIGRADQSVTVENMIKRLDQQFLVTKLMMGCFTKKQIDQMPKGLQRYLYHELSMMLVICSSYTCLSHDKDLLARYKTLLRDLKGIDPALYRRVRYGTSAAFVNIPGGLGRALTRAGYRLARKRVNFT